MFQNSMATPFSSSSSSSFSSSSFSASFHDHERINLESMRALVVSINKYIHEFLENPRSRNSLKLRCTSKLKIQKQEFFEFSEHSVLSNLYWGIESIESAVRVKCSEEKMSRLKNCERMLQVPALLDEQRVTAGISNRYLVCCSYFYLSVVGKLQRNELQVALHFLQALLVFPRLVCTELAPELCKSLFPFRTMSGRQASGRRSSASVSLVDFGEDEGDAMRQIARRYKDWLMYYQVMLYGETPQWNCQSRDIHLPDDESEYFKYRKSTSTESSNSIEEGNSLRTYHKANADDTESSMEIARTNADDPRPEICDQRKQASCSVSNRECTEFFLPHATEHQMHKEAKEVNITKFFSGRFHSSISDLTLSMLELRDKKSHTLWNFHREEATTQRGLEVPDFQLFNHMPSTSLKNYRFTQANYQQSTAREQQASRSQKFSEEVHPEKDSHSEAVGIFEKAISRLCFSEGLGKCDEDYSVEVTTIYEVLNSKIGVKYALLKDVILDQLLTSISTSKEEGLIRASVSILSSIVSGNKSAIEDIKKKGLQLCDLANALKRNVHEAAILIYLINPSPTEIRTLELLPKLVEVVCTSNNYKSGQASLLPTPPVASLMMIEVLVTAFDYATNNIHLAAISSPRVLSGLLDVAINNNLEEFVALASILVKCMSYDGQCRKYISQLIPVAPFVCILRSNETRAKFIALEFFHEILRMPRSSAISLLQKIQKEGSINIMHILMPCLQQLQSEHQLLAANLLLQLDMLEDSSGKSIYREEAMKVLLESVASEECSTTQLLSSFILSNLGGTYAWTGEPYTVAWLVRKAGLNSLYHRNMIRNFDWLDQSLQDASTDTWCSKIARRIIKIGNPLFHALEMGLKSKTKRVSRDCLTAIAWLGYEISKSPNDLRYSACEILLGGIEQFLHPGLELEERLLACLCIYNYTSGKGMQKLLHFSEGVRESLRRLSNITWMAEELLKVADYFQPNKARISCVHTQILEAVTNRSGAVSALIYYKGQLYGGYSDGSIKVWDIKGQSATLIRDIKEHRKAVTCFSLFGPGDSLLSGSADKTIRVWQMVQRKLECIEVIATKEPIQSLDTHSELIFVVTQSHAVKVFDASRTVKDTCKGKHVKCIRVVHGKIYIGCIDSSIQELTITNTLGREIRAPAKSWRMQNKPINSIAVYKDWLYSAGAIVEGSNFQEWRRHNKPQMSIVTSKGANVLAMAVVEDFIYLNCSSSASILQIWLRGSQQKVGRLSAGSRITSLLTANDIVLCGTETGQIKGWIPL